MLVHVSALQRHSMAAVTVVRAVEPCQIVVVEIFRASCPRLRQSRLFCLRLRSWLHQSAKAPEPLNPVCYTETETYAGQGLCPMVL